VKRIDASFFDGKRPWSRIKDRVLGSYLPPFLRKTQRLRRPIVVVDCFAGRGKFSDGTPGSPLIICQQIKRHAPGRAIAYFVNKRPEHHESLSRTLRGFIETGMARPVLGQGESFLTNLTNRLQDQTVLVYLDPFGIKGCNFAATKRLLQRNPATSTEILMTLSMPVLHRLAARDSAHAIVSRFHAVLDGVLGDVAWRDIMFDNRLNPTQKEELIIADYCAQLRKYVSYACSCPVRDHAVSRTKYYIVFASRHPQALTLMNDIMLNAYQDHTLEHTREHMPLLEPILDDWRGTRTAEREALSDIIRSAIGEVGRSSRAGLWQRIVIGHFMQYREAEFRDAVQELVNTGAIEWDRPANKRRIDDKSILVHAPRRNAAERDPRTRARLSF
jgi:three-Cys-motif partner protein